MVLIKIPDGKSKEMSVVKGKVDPSKLQGGNAAGNKAMAAAAAAGGAGGAQATPAQLAALQAAKDKVATLKKEGAAKGSQIVQKMGI